MYLPTCLKNWHSQSLFPHVHAQRVIGSVVVVVHTKSPDLHVGMFASAHCYHGVKTGEKVTNYLQSVS